MIVNYVLLMIILPAAIIVVESGGESFTAPTFFTSKLKCQVNQLWYFAANNSDIVFSKIIPHIVRIIRIPLILLTFAAFAVSIYAIVKTPGIRLPERNSIQVS